jgi:hypothetical protein
VDLLAQVEEPVAQVTGDGSYDQRQCYEVLSDYQALQGKPLRVAIPPHKAAAVWKGLRSGRPEEDNQSRQHEMRTCIVSVRLDDAKGSRKVAIVDAA